MCSYISCPGWRNGWHMWYLAISGEDLATCAFWNLSIVTYMPWQISKTTVIQARPQDDESSH